MGCGKSHVGKELSVMMNYTFLDTDEQIMSGEYKTIDEIFSTQGEDYFRKAEKQVLHKTSERGKTIVATGGGLPCFFDNIYWMNRHGITVYLRSTPEFLLHRLCNEKTERPLISKLGDDELKEFICNKLRQRKSFYEQAHIKVNAEDINLPELKKKIVKAKLNAQLK
jgi:shikimate kinase